MKKVYLIVLGALLFSFVSCSKSDGNVTQEIREIVNVMDDGNTVYVDEYSYNGETVFTICRLSVSCFPSPGTYEEMFNSKGISLGIVRTDTDPKTFNQREWDAVFVKRIWDKNNGWLI